MENPGNGGTGITSNSGEEDKAGGLRRQGNAKFLSKQ